jgi:hypothetical protein
LSINFPLSLSLSLSLSHTRRYDFYAIRKKTGLKKAVETTGEIIRKADILNSTLYRDLIYKKKKEQKFSTVRSTRT